MCPTPPADGAQESHGAVDCEGMQLPENTVTPQLSPPVCLHIKAPLQPTFSWTPFVAPPGKRGPPGHPKLSCDFGTGGEEGGPAGAPSRTFRVNGRDSAARPSTPDWDPSRPPHSLAGQSPGRSHRSPGVRAGSSGNGSRGGGGGCCVLVPVGK
ncbi:unnamed protein product [Rangifer tarandus platyrhynchus]|uniref:Uncharacterized protein n=1 Tax=Rangifer tarandus platyrhynchus TaxID=3082113 RepID=A0AC59ZK35_RANTA